MADDPVGEPIDVKDAEIAGLRLQISALTQDIFALQQQLAAPVAVAAPVDDPISAVLDDAGIGSVFSKVRGGWRVEWMTAAGTLISVGGATITEALASHGLQRTHDSHGNEHGQPPMFEVPR